MSQLAAMNKILVYLLFAIPQLVGIDAQRDYPGIAGQLTAQLKIDSNNVKIMSVKRIQHVFISKLRWPLIHQFYSARGCFDPHLLISTIIFMIKQMQ
jgi:hypothetical protein